MKQFLFLIAFFCSIQVFGQKEEESLLKTYDNSWRKEIIPMPLHFAPQIPYKGVEEVRFAKGWSKIEDDTFWTYAFVWDVDLTSILTTNQLESYMQYYFDGLMAIINKDKSKVLPKTVALFLEKDATKNTAHFVGKIQVYDAFHTKDLITLYCTVQQYYCEKQQKSMVLFHLTPKEFDHATWNELHTVTLTHKPCKM
jgi:hypothetical protein